MQYFYKFYTFSLQQNQNCQFQITMQFLSQTDVKLPKLQTPHKVLQALKKIQFIVQFFVLSKYSSNPEVISQFLLAIQAFKFYYKMAHFTHQQNLYVQNYEQKQCVKQKKALKPLQKMSQLLQKIKTKTYQCQNFQPQQFQQLACGKKVQLITSVPIPNQLKRAKLNFSSLLGEVLSLLRPLLSIIAIRLFGIDSYKSYFASLIIDLFILIVLQRNIVVSKKTEVEELQSRKKQILMRYLFRRPFFLVLKKYLIEPGLQKIIRSDRIIYKIILSLLEMQSSITLTL